MMDVDALKKELTRGSKDYPGAWGPKLVRQVRRWLKERANDYSVRAIWIDERGKKE